MTPIKWEPHNGQKKMVKFLLEHPAAGLFCDPGIGKTSAVYAAFKVLQKKQIAKKMLVIAPLKPCYLVWGPEASKWIDFSDIRVEILHGPKKDEALARDADVYVINPDGIDWLLGVTKSRGWRTGRVSVGVDEKRFRAFGFDILVIDELTQFKNTGSIRHKALKTVLGTFQRRWGLTGTPAPNGLIDLFGQVYCLDLGKAFGPYITHYRNQYFLPSFDGFSWTLRKGADVEIQARLKPLVLRLAADDYIDMPAEVENTVKFTLPTDARRIYDELEKDLVIKIGEGKVTAATMAAASIKLRQVVAGGVYLDDEAMPTLTKRIKVTRNVAHIHDEKTDLLADLVEELQGSPLLVAYEFKHDLERLQARFGKDVPYIGGGTTAKRATELEAAWNRSELPILLGHPLSIGHGLNLQHAGNHVAWYSLPWARDIYDQFNGRVRRQGSKHQTVFIHHFMAENTIDVTMYYALRQKAKVQDALLKSLGKKK